MEEKGDEIILPGFRFHPTDEELVGFYLKRKIQQKPLSIELIKQLDIYKYDPWDLPRLAMTGEKEWYFYCPRDRKYRNSSRPNRVTGAGFWKATGTDRPIYSSEGGNKCIGLKKSLVFYRGRAAKGVKTDWMMHEFRLPSISDNSPPKSFLYKSISANDSWAICRIFKKMNTTAQRALSQSWMSSPLPETLISDHQFSQFMSENTNPATLFYGHNDDNLVQQSYNFTPQHQLPNLTENLSSDFASESGKCNMLLNMSSSVLGDMNGFSMKGNIEEHGMTKMDQQWETFPSSADSWNNSSLLWDSNSLFDLFANKSYI